MVVVAVLSLSRVFEYVYSSYFIGRVVNEYAFHRVLHVSSSIARPFVVTEFGPLGPG